MGRTGDLFTSIHQVHFCNIQPLKSASSLPDLFIWYYTVRRDSFVKVGKTYLYSSNGPEIRIRASEGAALHWTFSNLQFNLSKVRRLAKCEPNLLAYPSCSDFWSLEKLSSSISAGELTFNFRRRSDTFIPSTRVQLNSI